MALALQRLPSINLFCKVSSFFFFFLILRLVVPRLFLDIENESCISLKIFFNGCEYCVLVF